MILKNYIYLLLSTIPVSASAEVFKCEIDGRVIYQSYTCPSESTMNILHPNGSKDDIFRKSGTNMDGWHFGCSIERLEKGFSKSLDEFDIVSVCGYASGVTQAQALKLKAGAEILEKSPTAGMKFIQWIRDDGAKYRLEWKEKENVIANATLFLNSTNEKTPTTSIDNKLKDDEVIDNTSTTPRHSNNTESHLQTTYTPYQLKTMIDSGKYPDQGPVINTQTKSMTFNACKMAAEVVISQIRENYPVATLVDTNIVYTVKAWANDGAVLVNCSQPDQKMVITRSPYK